MKKQIELKEKMKLTLKMIKSITKLILVRDYLKKVSSTSCACMSWMSMKLPCRHIFVVQMKLEIDLFGEELCDVCWSVQYYK